MTLTTKPNRYQSYEVYDERGNPVGRVVLPRQRRFLGAERGTVFMSRQPALRHNGSQTDKPRAA